MGYFAAPKYQSAEYWKEFKSIETFNDGIDGIYYQIDGDQATVTYRDNNYNSYSGKVVLQVIANGIKGCNCIYSDYILQFQSIFLC